MLERLIHLLMCTQGNCVHRLWWPLSPQGVISESKYIFRAVLEEDRRQPGEAGRGGDGRKSQDEENCTVKQTGFGITNPEEMNAGVRPTGTIPAWI